MKQSSYTKNPSQHIAGFLTNNISIKEYNERDIVFIVLVPANPPFDPVSLFLASFFYNKHEQAYQNHLFRRNEPFPWDLKIKILIGAARGLAFLHSSEREVIYRDFKASNILLDSDYEAKLSDFGLAKLGPANEKSHVTTRVMGTYGYAAPEYMATGHLYVKSDVYAFGVVLLEVMTGLRAHNTNRPNGQENLVDWLRPELSSKHKVMRIMDKGIKGQYTSKVATEMGKITLSCTESDPKNRPHMKEVLGALENIQRINVVSDRSAVASSSHTAPPRSYQYGYRAGMARADPRKPA